MDLSPSEWSVHLEDALAHGTPAGVDARLLVRVEQHAQHEVDPSLGWIRSTEGQHAWALARARAKGGPGEAVGKVLHRSSLGALLAKAIAGGTGTPDEWPPLPPRPDQTHGDPLCGWTLDDSALIDSLQRFRGELPGRAHVLLADRRDTLALLADAEGGWRADRVRFERLFIRVESEAGAVVDAWEAQQSEEGTGGLTDIERATLLQRLRDACDAANGGTASVNPHLPVVLRPPVAAAFLAQASAMFHGPTAVKTPGLLQSLNKRLFPEVMTLKDGARAPSDTVGRSFDDEGCCPAGDVTLVDEGRLTAFLHTRASARAVQGASQGRTFLGGDETPELRLTPRGLHITPRTVDYPEDYTELCARFETFTARRHGLTTCIVGGYTVRQGKRVEKLRPWDMNVPALEVLRKVRGVAGDLAFFPALQNVGTPSLLCAPFHVP